MFHQVFKPDLTTRGVKQIKEEKGVVSTNLPS